MEGRLFLVLGKSIKFRQAFTGITQRSLWRDRFSVCQYTIHADREWQSPFQFSIGQHSMPDQDFERLSNDFTGLNESMQILQGVSLVILKGCGQSDADQSLLMICCVELNGLRQGIEKTTGAIHLKDFYEDYGANEIAQRKGTPLYPGLYGNVREGGGCQC